MPAAGGGQGERTMRLSDRELIETIDDEGDDLTDWEITFVDDMLKKLKQPGVRLSAGERAKAEEIYEERC